MFGHISLLGLHRPPNWMRQCEENNISLHLKFISHIFFHIIKLGKVIFEK